ncbi:MAG: ferrous iron transport protein A [Blautia sp.]|nr:ferrous iron transport protein A [Blautia sp.]
MMPVTMACLDEVVTITRISGKDEVRHHLHELGLIEGEKITVVSNNGGNVILQAKGVRIALDEKMANRIYI